MNRPTFVSKSTAHYRKQRGYESESDNEDQFQDISIQNILDEEVSSSSSKNSSRSNSSSNGNFLREENTELEQLSQHSSDFSYHSGEQNQYVQDNHINDLFEEIIDESSDTENESSENDSDDNGGQENQFLNGIINDLTSTNYHEYLNKFLEKDDSNNILNLPLIVSKAEVILAVLKFSTVYSLPVTGITDLFQLLNVFTGSKVFPDTRYRIDKLFNSKNLIQYHAVCSRCKKYIDKFDHTQKSITCNSCNLIILLKSPLYRDFFAVINVRNEIKNFIEQNSIAFQSIINKRSQMFLNDDILQDFCDGLLYKQFINSLSNDDKNNSLTCTFNTDGAPIFESSTFSVWPIQFIINEMPYDQRIAKPITCGIWFGRDKPNMNIFLRPYVLYMNEFVNTGVKCFINNEERQIKIFALCCCVDSVARAPMQGIRQFNGHYGCSWCLHPGLYVRYQKGGSMKYIMLDTNVPERTERETILHMQQSLVSAQPVYGIKNPSILLSLNKFNIISGFVPDPMHFINLGIGKQFASYWHDTNNLPYSWSKNDIDIINNILQNLKVPNKIARLSRTLQDRKWWKALEWENWILYYSLPILKSFHRLKIYADHWELLVEAYHILLQNNINRHDLIRAHEFLKRFVVFTEEYYSYSAMTYNVHQLLHVTQSVIDWGPLWSHSGYCFENGNGLILKKVHAAKGVVQQICRAVSIDQCQVILEKHITNLRPHSEILNYTSFLSKRENMKTLKMLNIRYFGKNFPTEEKWIRELNLSENCKMYTRIFKDNCLYTSFRKKQIRSNNSFAITSTKSYIRLLDFLIDVENTKEYSICNIVNTENSDSSIKLILNISDIPIAIKTKTIEKVCVVIDVHDKKYISAVPNMYNH